MNVILKGLQAALSLIETNGWWDGQTRMTAPRDASLNTMCVVTATYWAGSDSEETSRYESERELQFPLWLALPEECRTRLGRTKDLIAFNDSRTEADVKDLFARAIAAEIAKS